MLIEPDSNNLSLATSHHDVALAARSKRKKKTRIFDRHHSGNRRTWATICTAGDIKLWRNSESTGLRSSVRQPLLQYNMTTVYIYKRQRLDQGVQRNVSTYKICLCPS